MDSMVSLVNRRASMTSSSFSTNSLRITLTKANGFVSSGVESITGDVSVASMVVESMPSVEGLSVSAIVGLVGSSGSIVGLVASSGSNVDSATDVSWMTWLIMAVSSMSMFSRLTMRASSKSD